MLEDQMNWNELDSETHFVSMSGETLRRLVEKLDDSEVIDLAKKLATLMTRERMLYLFKRTDLDSYISYLQFVSKYQKLFSLEVRKDATDGKLSIVTKHDFGEKWSLWLENSIGEAVRVNFPSVQLEVEKSRNVVIFKLSFLPEENYNHHRW